MRSLTNGSADYRTSISKSARNLAASIYESPSAMVIAFRGTEIPDSADLTANLSIGTAALSPNDVTTLAAQTTLRVERRDVPMSPGMAVSVEIKTGTRRLIDYFLSPIQKHVDESLKER
jgi:hypothetical protein